jgi:hypothetical protein
MLTRIPQPVGRAGHYLYRGDRVRVVPISRDGEVTSVDSLRQRVGVSLLGDVRSVETAARRVRKK